MENFFQQMFLDIFNNRYKNENCEFVLIKSIYPDFVPLCVICNENSPIWFQKCGFVYCKDCLRGLILSTSTYPVRCNCGLILSDNQCYKALKSETHRQYRKLQLNSRIIENSNLYPCYKPSCIGTFKSDGSKSIKCDRCSSWNCTDCQVVHKTGETCAIWRENNSDIVETRKTMIEDNKKNTADGKGMTCTKCGIFLEKKDGCDYIICSYCGMELCFATKMSRWGPNGHGDLSGGCRCMVNNVLCHPNCKNCHGNFLQ